MGQLIAGNVRADTAQCVEICTVGTSTCFTCAGTAKTTTSTPTPQSRAGEVLQVQSGKYKVIFQAGTALTLAEINSVVASSIAEFITVNSLGSYDGLVVVTLSTFGNVNSSDDGLSDAAIAGIVVGSVCFVFIIVVAIYFCCCRAATDDSAERQEDSEMCGVDDAPDCADVN